MPTPSRLAGLAAAGLLIPVLSTAASAAGTTLDVATTGKDSNAGTPAAPLRTIQAAIDKAKPGTTIRIHKGTYNQVLTIKKSGTASAPITMTSAGDGPVTVTSTQPSEDCDSRQPTPRRTMLIAAGSDWWTFSNLTIDNGVYINGGGGFAAYTWHAALVKKHQWEPRRQVPGSTRNDPAAAKTVPTYLANLLDTRMNPADHLTFEGNVLTGRGIHANFSNYGVVKNNVITDIDCGTGPALWIITFSQFWDVTGNDVSKIAVSGDTHFMQEGIRLGTASNYNRIANNHVHDLAEDSRGFATDVDASFNVFENNKTTNVPIAFNDEMSGWGNVWRNNRATKYRILAFGFRLKDSVLTKPSKDTSTHDSIVTGNVAESPVGGANALSIGAIAGSTFSGNTFPKIKLGRYVPGYWASQGNTWNGTTKPPLG